MKKIRVAQLTTDARDHNRQYSLTTPYFGAAPEALLQGFAAGTPEAEIHVVSCTQKPMSSPQKLAENIWFHSLHVPKIGWLRTGYQGCIRSVRKKLQEIQPVLVHGQGTERDCALEAVFSGFPNLLTIHGNMAELARLYQARPLSFGWLAGLLEDLALSRTNGVFCNSLYTKSLVAPRTHRTWHVPNAIRTGFFVERTSQKFNKHTFLNIGVISQRKRQVEILKALLAIRREGLDFHITFVGQCSDNDPYASTFQSLLRSTECRHFATHLDTLSVEPLVSLMDQSHALIHFPEEESFGLVVAEALTRNLKVFASSVGGLCDIAAGVEAVELIPPWNLDALAAKIRSWLTEGCPPPPPARDLMRVRYHPCTIARRHLEIYSELMAE